MMKLALEMQGYRDVRLSRWWSLGGGGIEFMDDRYFVGARENVG
jgi:hypothetical protein